MPSILKNHREFYPQILTRGAHLRSLLSSIPSQQQEESQARLIFETQLAYVVESHNVGLSLIAAELVISVAGLYHMLNGWSDPESPFNLSEIRIFVHV
jgi:hypothetical protein